MSSADGGVARGALTGIRVLDLTSVVMGPLATQILGDHGADVITIESARGDTNRRMSKGPVRGLSDVSLNLLRNKRNLAIDLKDPAAKDAVLALAATCEVFVTNLRPGPISRLGLDYAAVSAVRPDVVYVQATGFASDDPRSGEPAYDDIIQGATGVPDVVRRASGEMAFVPTLIADKVSGLTLAYGILAALVHRERTGEGQFVEVPMFDAVSAFLMVEHSAGAVSEPVDSAGYRAILTSERRPQRSRDGYVVVFPYLPAHWSALLTASGLDELIGDARFAPKTIEDRTFIYETLERIVVTKTTAQWLEFCRERSIPATAVASIDDVVASWPELVHPLAGRYHSAPAPVRLSRSPSSVRTSAALIGQHNREVLEEAGLSAAAIDDLEARGVLRSQEP